MRISRGAGRARIGGGSLRARVALGAATTAAPFVLAASAQAMTVTVTSTPVTEGNSGTTTAIFRVTVACDRVSSSGAAPVYELARRDYTVSLGGGTATPGVDYDPTPSARSITAACTGLATGTVTRDGAPNQDTFTATVIGDTLYEADETFNALLTNANSGAVEVTGPATIVNDDTPPAVNLGDATVAEGTGSGTSTMSFPVTLDKATGADTVIRYNAGGGTAASGADYVQPSPTATITIPAGQTTGTISIPVVQDNLDEGDETFNIAIASVVNGVAGARSSATGTIADDDLPRISIGAASALEGAGALNFPITLSNPSARAISVTAATADSTDPAVAHATAGDDYTPVTRTITFAPGETSKPFTVTVTKDGEVEPDEQLQAVISAPSIGTIAAGAARGTIVNDDKAAPPTNTGTGSGVPTGPTGNGSSVPPSPKASIGTLRASGRRLTVPVSCPVTIQTCRVRLTVFTVPNKRSKIRQLRSERKLGTRVLIIPAGRSASVTLTLSATTRKLLRRAKRIQVKAYAVTSDNSGNVGTTSRGGTLRK